MLTRSIRLAALTAVVALSALSWVARAEEPAPPKTYVVLVGAGSFDDAGITARPAAENDAKALYKLFTDSKYLGVPADQVRLLLGSEDKELKSQAATRENILASLKWVVDSAGKNDMVVVAMFGQGAPFGDRTCYFAKSSTIKDRAKDAVGAGEMEQIMEKLKSEKLLALIDVNYKGFKVESGSIVEPNILDMVRVFVGAEDKEEHTLPPGHVIFLASNTVAAHIDDGGQSIFAKTLIDALHGKADKEGYEPDGVVTIDELQTYMEKEQPVLARSLGKTREEKEQAPLIWGSRSSHFVVTRNPEVAPKADARVAKLATIELPADAKTEGAELIARMPKLKKLQELRKEYIKLVDGEIEPKDFLKTRADIQTAMRLERDDADSFARKVMDGVRILNRIYVKELNQGELVAWSVKGLYRQLEAKVPESIKKQVESPKELRAGQLVDLLTEARMALGKREDLDSNKDVDIALKTMMFNLDPYTTYYDSEQSRQMDSQLTGRYSGIGIQIRRDMVRDGLLVVSPIKDSPAYRAKINAGDLITEIILEVDKQGNPIDPPEVISTKGMKTDEAVKKILGIPGTKVKVKVLQDGQEKPVEVELTRSRIDVETVMGVKRNDDDSWEYMIDPQSKIAYMRLTQFAPRSFDDMKAVVAKLDKLGVKGVILDLRFNPGGLLPSAVDICDLFIDDGAIVTIKPRAGVDEEQTFTGQSKGSFLNFPMVCMVNGMSASGSEIVAACLQDHGRAIILGERSYGKGSVQNILNFTPTQARIKLTTATFWRPNGKNLNKSSTSGKDEEDWGVRPDSAFNIPIPRAERDSLFEQMRDNEIIPNRVAKVQKDPKPPVTDKQLDAALTYLRSQIRASK